MKKFIKICVLAICSLFVIISLSSPLFATGSSNVEYVTTSTVVKNKDNESFNSFNADSPFEEIKLDIHQTEDIYIFPVIFVSYPLSETTNGEFGLDTSTLPTNIKDYLFNYSDYTLQNLNENANIKVINGCFAIPVSAIKLEYDSDYVFDSNFNLTTLPNNAVGRFELFQNKVDPVFKFIVINENNQLLTSGNKIYYLYGSSLPSWLYSSTVSPTSFNYVSIKNDVWTRCKYILGYKNVTCEIYCEKILAEKQYYQPMDWFGWTGYWVNDYNPVFYCNFLDNNTSINITDILEIEFYYKIKNKLGSSKTYSSIIQANISNPVVIDNNYTYVNKTLNTVTTFITGGPNARSNYKIRDNPDYVSLPLINNDTYTKNNKSFSYRFVDKKTSLGKMNFTENISVMRLKYAYEDITYIYDNNIGSDLNTSLVGLDNTSSVIGRSDNGVIGKAVSLIDSIESWFSGLKNLDIKNILISIGIIGATAILVVFIIKSILKTKIKKKLNKE